MIDGLEDRRVALEERLVLELEVLDQREHDRLGSPTGDLVIPVGHVRLDGDRRKRRRVDVVSGAVEDVGRFGEDDPPRRCSGEDDAAADDDEPATDQGDADDSRKATGAASVRQSGGEPAELVGR